MKNPISTFSGSRGAGLVSSMSKRVARLTLILLCSAVMLTAPTGCKTLKGIYNAGTFTIAEGTADQIVADAEKGVEIGMKIMVNFVHQEKDHRVLFDKLGTKPHELSVWLRVRVPDPYYPVGPGDPPIHFVPRTQAILSSVRIATETFRTTRTPENEANLRTVWATLQGVLTNCKKFTTAATGTTL